MAEVVPDSDDQVLHNFLTHSSWDHRRVMDQVAGNANELIGASSGAGLYIDESAFQKKGTKPVGVARQWNGFGGGHADPAPGTEDLPGLERTAVGRAEGPQQAQSSTA